MQAPPSTGATPASLMRTALSVLATIASETDPLGEMFASAGHELALVGGPVRDAFLGRRSADLDFATSATPDQTEAILTAWGDATWDVGREFGTIAARRGDVVVEITTYRTEEYRPGSRKPAVVFGDTLEGDLSRRDFRVNAMAVRLPDLTFVDPFDGLTDLADGVLNTPASPQQSFDDDPLRILRAARFSAQLGLDVDPGVMTAMTEYAPRLEIVSAERVQAELVKTLLAASPRRGIELLVETGVLDVVLPEVPAMRLEIDEHHRHKDVYTHSLTVLDQAIALETGPDGAVPGPDLVLRLAALLHDIGKPDTRRNEPGGRVSFHHHEIVGAKLARKRLKALKFDKATTEAVCDLIALHLRFHGYGESGWTDSAVRRYVTDAGPLLERLHRLTRADCTTRNRKKAERLSHAYDDLENRIAALREQESLAALRPALDGAAIMRILDLTPGPQVGTAYKWLMELRLDEGVLSPEDAEARLRAWWAEQPGD
ncbi:CCA tRNA nucleotidyltransferase [Serinibacter arcticus]|uniref:CCA tRNA nucleotidyltransferase n=1 Tax=Serinibacter arcticus TaxID=1655435 RepID=A0A2U1ZVU7_9MICO|nr:CCA tRNA nucleotidyltransferase [Serinibacter arcticus]PWD51115.1 CCA tRNA nucleotidyltransferase [Serinibacter arcticus]